MGSPWRQALSYLMEISVEHSDRPYFLELNMYKGNYIMNSANANQSNQQLKRAFHEAFHYFKIYGKRYSNVLVLGLGLGSVIDLLQNRSEIAEITAVESDARVINWFKKRYDSNFEILFGNAGAMQYPDKKYDLIIIDLFEDDQLPDYLMKEAFWNTLKTQVSPGGIAIWNTLIRNRIALSQELMEKMNENYLFENINCFRLVNL